MYFRWKTADYFRSNFSSVQTHTLRFGYLCFSLQAIALVIILFAQQLKGQVHGLAHVHESNNFLFDLLVILSVNNPTHMYLSDHIL